MIHLLPNRKSASLFAWAILLLFCLSAKDTGCGRSKAPKPAKPATESRRADFLLRELKRRDLSEVNSMSARARIYAEGDAQSVSASANIIWIRDSVVWMNVRKLGIEAMRALITKDSVFLINRLDKTYSVKDLGSLERQYSLPAGFPLLQEVLLASAWFFPDIMLQSDIKDELHRLSGTNGSAGTEYRMEEGSFMLRSESFFQPRDSRAVTFSFGDYKKVSGAGMFPYLRSIEAYSPETGAVKLELELSDLKINETQEYRFNIPDHYEKID
ncbi:MAG: DUF4292 domain-containing protein [Saprospiraceae bacterium]|nr:DUF4292 domain-containing protein [Saprospiraceae bacterium]